MKKLRFLIIALALAVSIFVTHHSISSDSNNDAPGSDMTPSFMPNITEELKSIGQMPVEEKAPALHHILSQLQATTQPEGIRLLVEIANIEFTSEYALNQLRDAYQKLNNFQGTFTLANGKAATTELLEALAKLHFVLPSIPSQYYKTAASLDQLSTVGFDWDVYYKQTYVTTDPHMLYLINDLVNHMGSPKSESVLQNQDRANITAYLNKMVDYIPEKSRAALAGPTRAYLEQLIEFDRQAWRESKLGIDVIVNAIKTGQIDRQRLQQVTDQLNALAAKAQASTSRRQELLRRIVRQMPDLTKYIDWLWPKLPPQKAAHLPQEHPLNGTTWALNKSHTNRANLNAWP